MINFKKGRIYMKKFLHFLFESLAVFGLVAGIYYLYQKYIADAPEFDTDDEGEFDDFDFDDEDFTETVSDSREYVTLNSSESKILSNELEDDFDEISD